MIALAELEERHRVLERDRDVPEHLAREEVFGQRAVRADDRHVEVEIVGDPDRRVRAAPGHQHDPHAG